MASFGEELKRERELRDISLKEISEATKISIRFLEALEQNNFDILPGGVFNRGFIRAYARFIGVDGEEMVNAYLHEVSLREARHAQVGRLAARGNGDGSSGGAHPATGAPDLGSEILRPERRARARHDRKTPHAGSRPEIRIESRFSSRAKQEAAEGRTSLALWVLVVLVFLVGVTVLTLSLTTDRPAGVTSGSHAQALKARLNKKAEAPATSDPQVSQSPGDVTPMQPSQATVLIPAAPAEAESPAPSGIGGQVVAPPAPEHQVHILATEATRVSLECAGKVSLDQELWPGQARTIPCLEPVALSAANGGAVLFSIDGSRPALLGDLGQEVQGLIVAPVAPPATPPAAPSEGGAPESGELHAGI